VRVYEDVWLQNAGGMLGAAGRWVGESAGGRYLEARHNSNGSSNGGGNGSHSNSNTSRAEDAV